jgi:hypothetical protein
MSTFLFSSEDTNVSGSLIYNTDQNTIDSISSISGTWNPYDSSGGTWDFIPDFPITGSLSFTSSDAITPPITVLGNWGPSYSPPIGYNISAHPPTISYLLANLLSNPLNNYAVALSSALIADTSNPIVTTLNLTSPLNPITTALAALLNNPRYTSLLSNFNTVLQPALTNLLNPIAIALAAFNANRSNDALGIALATALAAPTISSLLANVLNNPLNNYAVALSAAFAADISNPIVSALTNPLNPITTALAALLNNPRYTSLLSNFNTVLQPALTDSRNLIAVALAAFNANPSDDALGIALATALAAPSGTSSGTGGSTPAATTTSEAGTAATSRASSITQFFEYTKASLLNTLKNPKARIQYKRIKLTKKQKQSLLKKLNNGAIKSTKDLRDFFKNIEKFKEFLENLKNSKENIKYKKITITKGIKRRLLKEINDGTIKSIEELEDFLRTRRFFRN